MSSGHTSDAIIFQSKFFELLVFVLIMKTRGFPLRNYQKIQSYLLLPSTLSDALKILLSNLSNLRDQTLDRYPKTRSDRVAGYDERQRVSSVC